MKAFNHLQPALLSSDPRANGGQSDENHATGDDATMDRSQPDHDRLLRSNLERVFSERDAGKRAAALAELYVAEPIMYEPTRIVTGQAAVAEVAGKLLDQFGPTFSFALAGGAVGHHGLACLRWQAGPERGPVIVTGTDAAEIVEGRIARLWVLIDPPTATVG